MTLTAIASVLWLPWAPLSVRSTIAVLGLGVLGVGLTWLSRRGEAAPESIAGRLWSDTHRAVFSPGALGPQVGSAILVVGSYVVVFMVAGRAVGAPTSTATMLPLVAPVLMTMLVPVTVAGWGIREAAATALWGIAGLAPEDGAAISVTYGLIVLVASAPGLIALTSVLTGDRDRRARPPRA
jgi:hypothetical protein